MVVKLLHSYGMTSVWKRLQRVNKHAAKFQLVASYRELTIAGSKKWYAALSMCVAPWLRVFFCLAPARLGVLAVVWDAVPFCSVDLVHSESICSRVMR